MARKSIGRLLMISCLYCRFRPAADPCSRGKGGRRRTSVGNIL